MKQAVVVVLAVVVVVVVVVYLRMGKPLLGVKSC